jgi:small subunit ribosomal protein S18
MSIRLLSRSFLSKVSLTRTSGVAVSTVGVRFKSNDTDDPFGVNFDDSNNKLGPDLPPKLVRDTTTGRLTGDVEAEVTEEERRLLDSPLEQDRILQSRVQEHWKDKVHEMGERVRESDMGTNVLGRSVKAQMQKEVLEDGSTIGRDDSGFSIPLTRQEFKTFSKFTKDELGLKVSKEDIPVLENDGEENDPDALKWLSSGAQRQMDDLLDDDPYSDLMPGDLSPSRLVNRKQAKPIPTEVLHHNNIDLLQRYLTPTGQIRNRVQTRLGARDQRRVAKLVKRARCLGLIPFQGQFKAERHGWIHADDIQENRAWENDLIKRGLVIKKDTSKDDS